MQKPDNILLNSESPKCEINAPPVPEAQERKTARISRSKDELAYWKRAIRSVPDSPYLYIELQRGGIRRKVSLETSNKAAAAHRAREIWYEVRAGGWKGYLEKYKPESLVQADPSVGTFVEALERTADLQPRTLRAYTNALKKIISDAFGLSEGTVKFGHGRGHKLWLEKVYSVRLSQLTPEVIQTWKRSFLATAAPDPVSQRSARVSCNSYLRCAKSLFSPRILKFISLEMPTVLPFSSVEFESRISSKYRSEFSITELIAAAREELADSEPEVFKIFALATFAGLRRREIDLLPWSSFLWDQSAIRIEATSHFSAKSEDSYSDVPIDPEVLELFRGYRAQATGEFVIESSEPPRPEALYDYYRCDAHFSRLIEWLRSHGNRSKKPLHALRKEFGSQLCQAHGIYAASRGLRHSSIAISAAFYTDSRARATVGLGHLLESGKVVEFKQEVA